MAQTKIGWRPYVATTTVTESTLLTSLYGVWNGDTTTSTLDSSIYGAWNGENNANDSVGTNHGTLMNGCTFTTGKIGQAFTFDGVNDYIEFPSNTMNLTGDFTISFWIYMRTRDTNNIMSNHGNDGINRGFYIDSDGSYALRFVANYLAPYYSLIKTDNSALFDLNVWNHYTFISKNGIGQWYKNGVANGTSGTVMTNGYITNNKPIIGGYRSGNAGTVGYNKNMALDAFTTWNKAISQDEVTQLYNLGTGTQYPFSGQTLPSANNQFAIDNGTLMNGCTFTDGKIGKAFTFDGVNDYVSLPDNSFNFTGDFSYSGWVRIPHFLNMSIFGNYTYLGGLDYGYQLYFNKPTNALRFSIHIGASGIHLDTSFTYTTDTWYHIVVTRKSSVGTKIYVNGSLNSSNNSIINPTYSATHRPALGVSKYSSTQFQYFFEGDIDESSIWNKELTSTEVTELYNSGAGKQLTVATPIVTNGLVLNLDASRLSSYPNAGTTWTDISGNGNNGTMVNGPVYNSSNGGQITFDGVNDYVNITNKAPINDTDFTYDFWFRINNNNDVYHTLITQIDGNYANYCALQKARSGWPNVPGNVYFQVQGNTLVSTLNGAGLVAAGIINYTAVAKKESGYYKLYLYRNGVLDNSMNTSITTINMSTWSNLNTNIGRNSANNGGYAEYLNGNIYIGRMYNKALSSSEVTQNFNATKSRFGL